MALLSSERTFTIDNLKKIRPHHLAYLMLALTMILPFFLFKRAGPNYAFFAELTSAICASLFIFFASLSIKNFVIYNRVSVYLVVFASYLVFDLIINPPIYPSLHWLYIGSILLCSLLASTLTNFAREQGVEKVFSIVCYGLMIGGLLQDVVIFLQMLHKDWLYGWIFYINEGGAYSGNIGQRNMTAHYLSWGILATAYLIYVKKLLKPLGWSLVLVQAIFLGVTNSRTLLVYMLAIIILLIVTYIWQKQISKSLLKIVSITVLLVLAFQAATLPIITTLQDLSSTGTTSISRLSNSEGISIRFVEWYKAWLIFLEHPWFGSGWGSYGYQSFVISMDSRFIGLPLSSAIYSNNHNILLNFLAEIGFIGTFIVIGGFTYTLMPVLRKPWRIEAFIIISMLIVSIIHSLLEFPLWYTHFFLVFIILTSCLPSASKPSETKVFRPKAFSRTIKLCFTVISVFYLLIAVNLYESYQEIDNLKYSIIQDNNEEQRIITAQKILNIGDKQPLLKAYSDMQGIKYIRGLSMDNIPNTFKLSLEKNAKFLPFPTDAINYLAMKCNNETWKNDDWSYYNMLKNYYPNSLPSFSIIISMNNRCSLVAKQLYIDCKKNSNNICSIDESEARFR